MVLTPRRRRLVEDGLAALRQVAAVEVGIRLAGEWIHAAVVSACDTRNASSERDGRHRAFDHRYFAFHDCSFVSGWLTRRNHRWMNFGPVSIGRPRGCQSVSRPLHRVA